MKNINKFGKRPFFERIKDYILDKTCKEFYDIEYKEVDVYKTVAERYPRGFTFEEMQDLDFVEFGTMLKQRKLLPPSYDRKPTSINIYRGRACGDTRVKLTFNSKTTDSYRVVGINGYQVSFGVNSYYLYEHSEEMSKVWEDFSDRIRSGMELKARYAQLEEYFKKIKQQQEQSCEETIM